MATIASFLDRTLRNNGIPIEGVSTGPNPLNRDEWQVQFAASATEAQKASAATILASLTPDLVAQDRLNAQAEIDNITIALKAIVLTLLDEINILRSAAGLAQRTPAQALNAIRTKTGTL